MVGRSKSATWNSFQPETHCLILAETLSQSFVAVLGLSLRNCFRPKHLRVFVSFPQGSAIGSRIAAPRCQHQPESKSDACRPSLERDDAGAKKAQHDRQPSSGLRLLRSDRARHRPPWPQAMAGLGRRSGEQRGGLRYWASHRTIWIRPCQSPLYRPVHKQPVPMALQAPPRVGR